MNENIDLINILRYRAAWGKGKDAKLMEKAANVISSLSSELKRKESGSWVKCSDRLPDANTCTGTKRVWGHIRLVGDGRVFQAEDVVYYEGNGKFTDVGGYTIPVIAWQPLPEPYKEWQE